jgi:uracil-DNA glycosylase
VQLPPSWHDVLDGEVRKPYFAELAEFVDAERAAHTVYPPESDVFSAFKQTPFEEVKVLLLGQDPYHDEGQAHGLCFSVRPGKKSPPSLVNIFKELRDDLGCPPPNHGCLDSWARQGVMLLNAVLTVRAHQPNSHKGRGWEEFTDAVIRALKRRDKPLGCVRSKEEQDHRRAAARRHHGRAPVAVVGQEVSRQQTLLASQRRARRVWQKAH